MLIDTSLIKQRFKKNLGNYISNAKVQNKMNQQLIEIAIDKPLSEPKMIFEIGCGPGYLTELVCKYFCIDDFFVNDLVEDAVDYVQARLSKHSLKRLRFKPGDAEKLPFPKEMDMIISGSTFQWFSSVINVIEKCFQSLNNNGTLIFSTFGKENMREIKQITGNGLNYTGKETYRLILSENFRDVEIEEDFIEIYFETAHDVLNHIKQTGVNAVTSQPWTKRTYNDFIQAYEQFKTPKGYRLTYHPIYISAIKPDYGKWIMA